MAALDVVGVSVGFDGRAVLDGVSLHVGSGEIVALHGPSGAGKSTLLGVIAGLVVPESGRVRVDGADVTSTPTHRRGIGMVFQGGQLFPHRSVLDNVAFGLQMTRVDRRTRHARSKEWLERVGLAGFGGRSVTDLSGGEARRVALARTLITEPRIVLLDEPLGGLDRELHDRLAIDLRDVLTASGITTVLVTHDHEEGAMVASRCVELASLSLRVAELRAEDTHDLRRRVLRAATPSTNVVFDGDDDPTTVHLGLVSAGRIVAVSTWLDAPFPGEDAGTQLRGMATEPALQGSGLGSRLLDHGLARSRGRGAEVVWARARVSALGFYLDHGFEVTGPEFVDTVTGLPHRLVRRRLP